MAFEIIKLTYLLTYYYLTYNCSRALSQINCFSERSMLRDSVYFTTLKSLGCNVVMTFRFNNNNNNNKYTTFWYRQVACSNRSQQRHLAR